MKKIILILSVVFCTIGFSQSSFAQPLLEVYESGNNNVGMNFTIGCTLNEVTFELQRSGDGVGFTTFFTATVTQARCGMPFNHTDNNPIKGICYYRYKLTNYNGAAGFSNVAAVNLAGSEKIKVVPTVAVNTISIFYLASIPGNSGWVLYDMRGRTMAKQDYKLKKGQNEIIFDVSLLTHGHYRVRGLTPEEKTAAIAIIKQ